MGDVHSMVAAELEREKTASTAVKRINIPRAEDRRRDPR